MILAVLTDPTDTASDEGASDADLVARLRGGDESALTVLVARHEPTLRAWLDRVIPPALRRRVAAEDVLQDAYVVAVRRIGEFEDRGEGAFRAWLKRIAELRLSELLRLHLGAGKRDGRREVTRGARPDTHQFAGTEPSPSQAAIGGELRDAVRRATALLRPDDRQVLRLVQSDGLTIAQCAERLGREYDATRKLYSRALARFAELVAAERGRP